MSSASRLDPEEVEMMRSIAALTGYPGRDDDARDLLTPDVIRIARASDTAVFVADARLPEAPIVFVNRQFSHRTGLSPDDVLGRSWTLLRATTSNLLAGLDVPGRQDPLAVELPDIGNDDRSASTLFMVSAVRDAADSVLAYVGVASGWAEA